MAHQHSERYDSTQNLKLAFFLNLGFAIIELIGGLLTNSLAITSDALHDLGDSLSLGLAWYLNTYAEKKRDQTYSYGYERFSLLGALINSLVLIGGSLYILYRAVPRLINPEPTQATGMLVLALIGITANGLAAWRLRGGRSLNVQVVSWHLLEDVLGWIAILIVSVVLLFTDFYILDPLLSVVITLYILYNVISKLRTTLALFLQGVPEDFDLDQFQTDLLTLEQVQSAHHTHVWSLDGEHHVLTTHVVVEEGTTKEETIDIKGQVKNLLKQAEFEHITVEIEFENEDCIYRE